jgi:GNAT superfamily N-acetyltransferase
LRTDPGSRSPRLPVGLKRFCEELWTVRMGDEPAGHGRVASELLARCHANTLEDYRVFARSTEGGAIEERPGLLLVSIGGRDSLENLAFVLSPPDDPGEVLDRALDFFRRHPVPWGVLAFPEAVASMAPALSRSGFLDEGTFPGMVLHPIPDAVPDPPSGFRVERARTLGELERLEHAASRAYEVPYGGADARWLTVPGLSLYIGYFRDEAVAHGALIDSHRVAGVAYIGTVPEQRRRGFAEAMVWRIVSEGRAAGCDAAYLWATPLGRTVYAKMGFRRVVDYRIWSAPGFPLPTSIRRH